MVDGDGELPGGCLRQAPVPVGAGLGGQLGLLLARGGDPPAEPLRRQVGVGRLESPRARPDVHLGARGAELIDGGRDGVRTEQAAAALVGVERRADGASSGSSGVRITRPTTVSASSIGHPAQATSIRASSSAVSRSSSAEAVTRLAPASSPRRQARDVRPPGLDRHRARRRPSVGDGELQQVRVPVVHHPVLRPGQPRRKPAAHRAAAAAEVVDHEAAGRGEVPPEALGELGRARRRVGRLAQARATQG